MLSSSELAYQHRGWYLFLVLLTAVVFVLGSTVQVNASTNLPDDTLPPEDPAALDGPGDGSIESYTYAASFAPLANGNGVFYSPGWLAVDQNTNSVYVTDRQYNRIQKFTTAGVFITKWGGEGSGDSQFMGSDGVAVDKTGNVYVSDDENHRVQKFTREGVYLSQFSTNTTGDANPSNPGGLAVDSTGNIFVGDQENGYIKKFNKDGIFISKFGGPGSGNGQFAGPQEIEFDGLGYIYVVDCGNNRIQKFTKTGVYVGQWGSMGSGNGQFKWPGGIAIDSLGYVYVGDNSNHRIQKFTAAGVYVKQWGSLGGGNGQFLEPWAVAVDRSGNVYVAGNGDARVQKFNSSGTYLAQWGPKPDGQVRYGEFLTTDTAGTVYVSDGGSRLVQKYNSAGTFLSKWGTIGDGTGMTRYNTGIAISPGGTVFVGDKDRQKILKYSLAGAFLGEFGSPSAGGLNVFGLTLDAAGNLFAADINNNRIQKFNSSSGAHLLDFGSTGSGNGQFNEPRDIAVDSAGYVYVVDRQNHRIQKFNNSGGYVLQWGGQGSAQGQFNMPNGIGIDNLGYIWVADSGNARLQRFTTAGVFLQEINYIPYLSSGFCNPTDVTFDASNTMYVADTCQSSGGVLKFTSNKWSSQFGYNQGWRVATHPRVLGDVNGDGMEDLVGFASGGVLVSLSTGTGFAAPTMWIAQFGYNQGWRVETHPRVLADVNGDGKADVVGFGSGGVMVSLSTGTGFEAPAMWIANYGYNQGWRVEMHPRMLADVNADGRADIVGFGSGGVIVSLSTGASFGAPALWLAYYGYNQGWRVDQHPRMLADVNGDGKADVVGFSSAGVVVSLSTGTSFGAPALWVANYGAGQGWLVAQHPRLMGEMTGDGKADIFAFGNDWVYISDSTGTAFGGIYNYINEYGYSSYAGSWRTERHVRLVGDVNGDGLDDIVGIHDNGVFVTLR